MSNEKRDKLARKYARSEGDKGSTEISFIAGWDACQAEVGRLRAALEKIVEQDICEDEFGKITDGFCGEIAKQALAALEGE